MYTSIIATVLAAAVIKAAPTSTGSIFPSRTVPLTRVTHSVVAGRAGQLIFDPQNVVAQVGDIVEWHFLPMNHSVAQSSFGSPCVPDADVSTSFFSGFQPTTSGQAPNVFQFIVKDSNPIWYYCAQGNHCESGMAGVINQNFSSANTLDAYKAKAKTVQKTVIPPVVQGGAVIPNPNPLGGF
ncbi:extracellular serine-rich protein [Coniella lustricola]|uniref:Extracellular serine-rich protein n=1 Tax=Coniella lustricola TaxID=2025994 RepID=A0A2T3AID0_9PEZI|nr:extracellular serine-rich protein [Coniella lustricola]